jgi:rod shape-determining protein MreC
MPRFLKHDSFARRPRQDGTGPRAPRRQSGAAFVAFGLAAIALLALSRLDHSVVRSARGLLAEAGAPVLTVAMVPFRPIQVGVRRLAGVFDAQQEAERLRDENQRLKGWEGRAKELERRIGELETLARVIPEQALVFATARVIADSSGPFVRMALLDAGRDNGFKNGFPVINVDGLVGRVVASGRKSSRLLLLNDLNSRVPVYIGRGSLRAMMLGDNGPYPRVAHTPADAKIMPGDDVVTSGVGGIFPRGLRIGTVVDGGDQLRVELNAKLDRLEYVSVLFFDSPGTALADDDQPSERVVARRRSSGPNGQPLPLLETGSTSP